MQLAWPAEDTKLELGRKEQPEPGPNSRSWPEANHLQIGTLTVQKIITFKFWHMLAKSLIRKHSKFYRKIERRDESCAEGCKS